MRKTTILVTEKGGKFGIGLKGNTEQHPDFQYVERRIQVWSWYETKAEFESDLNGIKALFNKPHMNSYCEVVSV